MDLDETPLEPDFEFKKEFSPNLLNAGVYLLITSMQVSTFAVNYVGRPFRESIQENAALYRGLMLVGSVAFIAALEILPPLNEWLQLCEFPPGFADRLTATMAADFVLVYGIERACKAILAKSEPRKELRIMRTTTTFVALTYHKGTGLVASGQVGVSPAVHVWRVQEPETVVASFVLPKGSKAVAAVAFSHDARFLVVAAADNDHTLCVFDVQGNKSEPVATSKGGSSAIVDVACAPSANDDRVFEFVAVGQKSDGTDINSVARASGPGLVAVATDNGNVEVVNWPAPFNKHVTARHVGKVHAAHVTNVRWANGERVAVSTGGRDGCVVFWDVVPVA
ncbi:hypothetical protein AMAG_14519 [Allomyces macrogynus ATCC 38327]|uniref:Anaphase-promoting complex subunit 4 WD40 domain-containing protein n=1 Tax=Allomyces macrogynus (strain ATCC 38327) TaxID=578462 RepID=A0A0L0T723_ALLM3|nr:hypothetical protein AMAG_14519 [Allomyces macrogynus ATCC 38327]|eukprot:KNE70379.1 hypothetical protein AMAG_14519 [Allomyces macrogynus ATCC 38327]